jgi:K+/H+ antiporter YhaU regulatory subunit KhtT
MKFNPTYLTLIEPGDTLIALGEVSKLKVLEEMIAAKK